MPPPALNLPATEHLAELRRQVAEWRARGLTVGFVPTMGALHEGHISLVRRALAETDRVVVSIFVNPKQFAEHEDLDVYPRTLEADAMKLAAAGSHLLYLPSEAAMYPEGFATTMDVDGPGLDLEADSRPQFFAGVSVVVTKLLNRVQPDVAVFGEKDYQQLLVVRRLVADLDMPVRIVAGETAREADGLALSSRNAYLSDEERRRAGRLNVILRDLAQALSDGEPIDAARAHAIDIAASVFDAVDYIEVRDADDLTELDEDGPLTGPARVLAAVLVGKTRLIDNMAAIPGR